MERRRYPNFDILRLFLALEVVIWHLSNPLGFQSRWSMPIEAVPAFVAISGYMILGSLEHSRNLGHFWWKRFLRITPAFVGCLSLVAVLWGWEHVLNSLRTWYTFGLVSKGPAYPLWSLSCEEVLYGGLSLLALLGLTGSNRVLIGLLAASLCILGAPSAGLLDPLTVKYSSLAVSFLMGALAYRMEWNRTNGALAAALFFLAVGLTLGGHPLAKFLAVPVAAAAMVAVGTAKGSLQLPADWSYGMYVYHTPLLWWIYRLGARGWLLAVAVLTVVLVVCGLSARFLESPALRLKNWRLRFRGDDEPEPVSAPNVVTVIG